MSKIEEKYNCALLLTHNLIGGKWKMRILWHIVNGDNRFSVLKRVIPDITEKVLYTNLKELEEVGIIGKEIRGEKKPVAVIYNLQSKYSKLESLIDSIYEFTKYYADLNKIEIEKSIHTKK